MIWFHATIFYNYLFADSYIDSRIPENFKTNLFDL